MDDADHHLVGCGAGRLGLPPAAYVERVRIEAAQRDLSERDDPVETIARHRYGQDVLVSAR